jgi:hypothetical protein
MMSTIWQVPARLMESGMRVTMTAIFAAIALGSPLVAQQRIGIMSGSQFGHAGYPHSQLRPVRRAGPPAHLGYPAFQEHRREPLAPPCTSFGLSSVDLLGTFPNYAFDFDHLNALSDDLLIKAAIDPTTQIRLSELGRVAGVGIEALPYFGLGYDYALLTQEENQPAQAAEPEPQPQVVIVQQTQPAPAQEPIRTPEEAVESPLPDEGQFVLVLRDGTEVEAVAFARSDNQVVYITTNGNRRHIPLSDLDSKATIRVNEERGAPLQL